MLQAVSPPLPHSSAPEFSKASFIRQRSGLWTLFFTASVSTRSCLLTQVWIRSRISPFSGRWLCSFCLDASGMDSKSKHKAIRLKAESDSEGELLPEDKRVSTLFRASQLKKDYLWYCVDPFSGILHCWTVCVVTLYRLSDIMCGNDACYDPYSLGRSQTREEQKAEEEDTACEVVFPNLFKITRKIHNIRWNNGMASGSRNQLCKT